MKKNKLAVAILPITAGLALTGTGFGLWHFQTTLSQDMTASIGITDVASESGTITLNALKTYADSTAPKDVTGVKAFNDNKFSLVLDQKHDAYWSLTGVEDDTAAAAATAEDVEAQFGYIYVTHTMSENIPASARDSVRNALNVTLTFAVESGETNFNKYLTFGSSTMQKVFTVTDAQNKKDDLNTVFVYQLPTVTWQEGKKPTTKTAYDTMKGELENVSFKLTAALTLVGY